MKIIALVKDLFFITKIAETAKQEDFNKVKGADLVILELEKFGTDCIQELKKENPEVKLIGYLSHVQVELKVQAEKAGCDTILPKSDFSRRLPELLTGK